MTAPEDGHIGVVHAVKAIRPGSRLAADFRLTRACALYQPAHTQVRHAADGRGRRARTDPPSESVLSTDRPVFGRSRNRRSGASRAISKCAQSTPR